MRRWKRRVIMVLTVLLLQVSSVIVDEDNMKTAIAATSQKEIRFKVGSAEALVNGKKVKIEKPYMLNDSTMVPVSMLVNGLGIKGEWTEPGYEYVITAGNRKIDLYQHAAEAVINRKEIYFNGDTAIRNGKLMAPVREIAEGLGAVVKLQQDKTITVTWDPKEAERDMSRVGSPSTGWSMLLGDPWYYSERKDHVQFYNYEKSLHIEMEVFPLREPIYGTEQLIDVVVDDISFTRKINDLYIGEIEGTSYVQLKADVIDSETNQTYMKIVQRAYSNDKQLFLLTCYVEENQSAEQFEPLLNSFRPQYVTNTVPGIEDQSSIRREQDIGLKDFGLQFKLSLFWRTSVEESTGNAYSNDGKHYINTQVYDAGSLSTAQVAERRYNYLDKSYSPGKLRLIESAPFRLSNGKTGILQRIIVDNGTETYTLYELHVVDHGCGYLVSFEDRSTTNGSSKVAQEMLAQIAIDAVRVSHQLQPSYFISEWDAVINVSLDRVNATMMLPVSWKKAKSFPEHNRFLLPVHGDILFYVQQNKSLDQQIKSYKRTIVEGDNSKLIKEGYTKINSLDAYEFLYEIKRAGNITDVSHVYLIQHGDNVDVITLNVLKAAYSEHIQQQLKQALQTYQFTNKKVDIRRGNLIEKE